MDNQQTISRITRNAGHEVIGVIAAILALSVACGTARETGIQELVKGKGLAMVLLWLVEHVSTGVWTALENISLVALVGMMANSLKSKPKLLEQLLVGFYSVTGICIIMSFVGVNDTLDTIVSLCNGLLLTAIGVIMLRTYIGIPQKIGIALTACSLAAPLVLAGLTLVLLPDNFGEGISHTYETSRYIVTRWEPSGVDVAIIVFVVIMAAVIAIIPWMIYYTEVKRIDIEEKNEDENESAKEVSDDVSEGEPAISPTVEVASLNQSSDVRDISITDRNDAGPATQPLTELEEPDPKRRIMLKRIAVVGVLIIVLVGAFLIYRSCSNSSMLEIEENSAKVESGIAGEAVFADGRTMTFKTDHTIPELLSDEASWEMVDDAVVIFTGEGTSYESIIGGYVYAGRYEDGQCWNEEWVGDPEAGGLDDVGYVPEPSKGERLKEFHWYMSNSGDTPGIEDGVIETDIEEESYLNESDRSFLKNVIRVWNETLNEPDYHVAMNIYAPQVKFYGKTMSADECFELRTSQATKDPSWRQDVGNDVSMAKLSDGSVRAVFTKTSYSDRREPHSYEAYLVFRKIDNQWYIVEEGDKTTDRNLNNHAEKEIDGADKRCLIGGVRCSTHSLTGHGYHAKNLFDGDLRTAWALSMPKLESDPGGRGQDCVAYIDMSGDYISKIVIYNGYQKSKNLFEANARPRSILIATGNSDSKLIVEQLYDGVLEDRMGPQTIRIDRYLKPYDYLTVFVDPDDIYPGLKYDDICLSEIEIYTR